MDETMPIPVTTTRLMLAHSSCQHAAGTRGPAASGSISRKMDRAAARRKVGLRSSSGRFRLEQADAHVADGIDALAVSLQPAIGNAEDELRLEDALEVDAVDDLLIEGRTWSANLTSPTPSARPRPGRPSQPRKKPVSCRGAIEAEAARHHRIAPEMAIEEPEVRLDVELGADHALAVAKLHPLRRSRRSGRTSASAAAAVAHCPARTVPTTQARISS